MDLANLVKNTIQSENKKYTRDNDLQDAIEQIQNSKEMYGARAYYLPEQIDLVLDAARSTLSQHNVAGWIPIEAAPKDGTRFLCYVPKYGAFTCHFYEVFHVMSCNPKVINSPTHWMPLPKPPTSEE